MARKCIKELLKADLGFCPSHKGAGDGGVSRGSFAGSFLPVVFFLPFCLLQEEEGVLRESRSAHSFLSLCSTCSSCSPHPRLSPASLLVVFLSFGHSYKYITPQEGYLFICEM
jgi:hypothetical protein